MLPLRHRGIVGFIGDDHRQNERAAVRSGGFVGRYQAPDTVGNAGGLIDAAAGSEIIIGVVHGEPRAGLALTRADNGDLRGGHRQAAAVVHLEEIALEIRLPGCPKLFRDRHLLGAIFVAAFIMRAAGPDSHLLVFVALPSGYDIKAEPAMRAASGGGIVNTAQVANSWMRLVTAARPAIRVKDSRL